MKKLFANLLISITLSLSLSTFASAQTLSNIRIKSAVNTAGSGKCLDVANGQIADGTPIVQFDCHNGNNQRFTMIPLNGDPNSNYYIIQTALTANPRIVTKMCIGLNNNADQNSHANPGDLLRLVRCSVNNFTNISAIWIVDYLNGDPLNGKRIFRSYLRPPSVLAPDNCMDVPSGANTNSLWMQLYSCKGGGNQQWSILSF